MYAPEGFAGSELGDVEVVFHDGVFHLFHLTLPNHDVIAHLVSPDGIRWEPRPPALRTGAPGEFDDDQLWTMSVQRLGGRFYMLYTALSRAEAGRVQRLGLAVSDDLERWEKLPGPVSEPVPPYRTDRDGAPWVAWRDPKPVILADGRVHVVLCAREPAAPALRQGAVAHLVSDDMREWEALPPLFAPRRHYEIECPQLFSLRDRFYLTAAVLEERRQRYWIADAAEGPFRSLDRGTLMPDRCYAARVCDVEDERWVFGFHDPGGGRGLRDRIVPSGLRLQQAPDGSLSCRRAPGWDALAGAAEDVDLTSLSARFENPRAERRDGVFVADSGIELFSRSRATDGILEAEITIDAPFAGVALEERPDGGGLFVELDRADRALRVVEYVAAIQDEQPWFTRRVLTEGLGEVSNRVRIEVIRAGGEVIVSTDDRVVVSTHHRAMADAASIGFLVDSGRLSVERARFRRLAG